MTETEAITKLDFLKYIMRLNDVQNPNTKFPKEYYTAINTAIDALHKEESMKPSYISKLDSNGNANVECPVCHSTSDYAVNIIKKAYCWNCGQFLDWSKY